MDNQDKPDSGVSLKIKVFVILLTIVTVIAFSAFFLRLIIKFSSSAKTSSSEKVSSQVIEESWHQELQVVGDKLKKAGLRKQAIEQYSEFLQRARVDSKTRAQVSETIGELYVELGDCRAGLAWFYRAQAAGPDAGRVQGLESQIAACLKEINSSQP
ncbi:MAG: hypothetical protein NPINA01_14040 [Nitrospinaceae bacterium]|nr:MAG: hypothetical protein NPINA01_14040 [Nitrospinaceae bacterium]